MITWIKRRFISFEGVDGCGKTTQLRALAARLRASGHKVVETAEPGGTEIGKQIRHVLLDPKNANMTKCAELLLYFASRAQNVGQVIRPALERETFVLCDRFTDSTLVYQGAGRGLGADAIMALSDIACAGLTPDLTILLTMDLDTSLSRARVRNRDTAINETRMDEQTRVFYASVQDAYMRLAAANPRRILSIEASGSVEEVSEKVWRAIEHPIFLDKKS